MEVIKINQKPLKRAIKVINSGGVIVCPTDTVYGLIVNATNEKAVEKIFKIKKRPRAKPLAVFVSSIKQAKELAEINKEQEKILKKYWPGKYTFILKSQIPNPKSQINPKFKIINSKLLTKNGTIALRITKHKLIIDLIKKTGKPLAQTSANISGKPASTKIEEVLKQFQGSVARPVLAIDGGNLPKSRPSKVIDLMGKKGKTLRY